MRLQGVDGHNIVHCKESETNIKTEKLIKSPGLVEGGRVNFLLRRKTDQMKLNGVPLNFTTHAEGGVF